MIKINMPFEWQFQLPSIVNISFQLDCNKLENDNGDVYEFPSIIIDLKTGQIYAASEIIKSGLAWRYNAAERWLVEGKDWWIGFTETTGEYMENIKDESIKNELLLLFQGEGHQMFETGALTNIIDNVCELAREKNLLNLPDITPYDFYELEIYKQKINNESPPMLE